MAAAVDSLSAGISRICLDPAPSGPRLLVSAGPCAVAPKLAVSSQGLQMSFRPGAKALARNGPCAVAFPKGQTGSWRGVGSKVRSAEGAVEVDVQGTVDEDPAAAQDLRDIQDIIDTTELLKTRRQMTIQECRLVLLIEDPREEEKRKQLGIENASGCSREEIAAAFMEVMEDRMPADRLALRKLAQDMRDWPRLREEEDGPSGRQQSGSKYAQITDVGVSAGSRSSAAAAEWDAAADAAIAAAAAAKDRQKDLGETLPPWVGYGVLYGFSSIPIIIGVLVVIILFLNSLQ